IQNNELKSIRHFPVPTTKSRRTTGKTNTNPSGGGARSVAIDFSMVSLGRSLNPECVQPCVPQGELEAHRLIPQCRQARVLLPTRLPPQVVDTAGGRGPFPGVPRERLARLIEDLGGQLARPRVHIDQQVVPFEL